MEIKEMELLLYYGQLGQILTILMDHGVKPWIIMNFYGNK